MNKQIFDLEELSILETVEILGGNGYARIMGNGCSGNNCTGNGCSGSGCSGVGCTGKECTGGNCTGKLCGAPDSTCVLESTCTK